MSVGFTLHVGQPDSLTEQFFYGQNDLAFQSLTFTPDGSANFYRVCRAPASELPTDPLGGRQVAVGDDGSAFVTLSGTNTVSLYGLRTNAFFINANGNLTLGKPDYEWVESLSSHFRLPRVSVLFDDFDADHSGGSVSWRETR